MARIEVHNEVVDPEASGADDWVLCFHDCTYHYDDGTTNTGYRFIWRKPNGNLQAARGQARIPNAVILYRLINKAIEAGWFSADHSS